MSVECSISLLPRLLLPLPRRVAPLPSRPSRPCPLSPISSPLPFPLSRLPSPLSPLRAAPNKKKKKWDGSRQLGRRTEE